MNRSSLGETNSYNSHITNAVEQNGGSGMRDYEFQKTSVDKLNKAARSRASKSVSCCV